MTGWNDVLLEGEPAQAFLDFADAVTADFDADGGGTLTAELPGETVASLERAIDRRALRLRGEDMIRASREGTAIRTKAAARCDAFLQLLDEFSAVVAGSVPAGPSARSASVRQARTGQRRRRR